MYKKKRDAWSKHRRQKHRWADLRKKERVVREARISEARSAREVKAAEREKKAAARAASKAAAEAAKATEAPPTPSG